MNLCVSRVVRRSVQFIERSIIHCKVLWAYLDIIQESLHPTKFISDSKGGVWSPSLILLGFSDLLAFVSQVVDTTSDSNGPIDLTGF